MQITIYNRSVDPVELATAFRVMAGEVVDGWVLPGRFTFDVSHTTRSVKIRNVRLTEPKLYCGNHPDACENPFTKPRRGRYLEGADWVDFIDRVNDVLDRLHVDALVYTSVCIIRKGRMRRGRYGSFQLTPFQRQWNMDEDSEYYADWCGEIAPPSWYPPGTPGEYTRRQPIPTV